MSLERLMPDSPISRKPQESGSSSSNNNNCVVDIMTMVYRHSLGIKRVKVSPTLFCLLDCSDSCCVWTESPCHCCCNTN